MALSPSRELSNTHTELEHAASTPTFSIEKRLFVFIACVFQYYRCLIIAEKLNRVY